MLKAVLDSLEGIEEATKALYKQDPADKKFYLELEGVEDHSGVQGLVRNRDAIKAEKEALATKIKAFGDTDPVKAKEALKKLAKLEEDEATKSGDFEALKKQMVDGHKVEMDAKDTEIAKRDKSLRGVLIENAARKAIEAEKGSVELLLPHVMAAMDLAEGKDGNLVAVVKKDGTTRVNTIGEPIGVEVLVGEFKASDGFRGAFAAKGKGGSGSGGDKGDLGGRGGDDRPGVVEADASGVVRVDPADVMAGKVQVSTE